jgi:hypothetical protein
MIATTRSPKHLTASGTQRGTSATAGTALRSRPARQQTRRRRRRMRSLKREREKKKTKKERKNSNFKERKKEKKQPAAWRLFNLIYLGGSSSL